MSVEDYQVTGAIQTELKKFTEGLVNYFESVAEESDDDMTSDMLNTMAKHVGDFANDYFIDAETDEDDEDDEDEDE